MFHKRLLKEFSDNMKYVIGMVVTQWVSLLANVVLMVVLAGFVESILKQDVSGKMLYLLIAFVAALLVRAVATTIGSRLSFFASTNVKRRLRELVYEKLMRLGASYRDTVATSEAVQVSTEGVDQLEIYFGKYVPQFFYSMLAPITLFIIVGTMSMKVAVILLLCVPLIPLSIVAVQKFAKRLLAKYWGTYTELGDTFLENLQGLTTLKIYQADERYAKKMDEEAEKFRKVTMRVLIMQLNSISIMDLVAYGGAAVGIILSILELRAGNISLAECFFITMISAEFFLPLRLLGSFFHIAMNGNAAADKIFKLLDAPESENGTVTEVEGSNIEFSNVSFGYTEDKKVLSEMSFEIPEKSFVAFVGASGCGKSTIASLIMGTNRGNSGNIQIGGVKLTDIKEQTLYRKVTRVCHDSYLFAGTVMDNLKMGKADASIHEMEEVLRQVDLYDTIMEKGGLLMPLSEKASNLSGGQKQRLALARALLHDSDIYIFDEATSNVDVESENKIMEVVYGLAHKKTVILISHRLANVVGADRIFVLRATSEISKEDDAVQEMQATNMVETGTHETLMEQGGYYASLYRTQQELENFAKEA
ncbi:MAG: ABC transporter ATP-binding protein/permease [Roseburia sp.]|nr:ABC transporter ATP-binding protein/permease [Roseburia sp.]